MCSPLYRGDRRVDLAAVKRLSGATYVAFAPQATAERLAGSVAGTVLPFSFSPDLELIADPDLRATPPPRAGARCRADDRVGGARSRPETEPPRRPRGSSPRDFRGRRA